MLVESSPSLLKLNAMFPPATLLLLPRPTPTHHQQQHPPAHSNHNSMISQREIAIMLAQTASHKLNQELSRHASTSIRKVVLMQNLLTAIHESWSNVQNVGRYSAAESSYNYGSNCNGSNSRDNSGSWSAGSNDDIVELTLEDMVVGVDSSQHKPSSPTTDSIEAEEEDGTPSETETESDSGLSDLDAQFESLHLSLSQPPTLPPQTSAPHVPLPSTPSNNNSNSNSYNYIVKSKSCPIYIPPVDDTDDSFFGDEGCGEDGGGWGYATEKIKALVVPSSRPIVIEASSVWETPKELDILERLFDEHMFGSPTMAMYDVRV
ncbi:hypothetical protein SmJEL517_g01755 [Synchytrium microbalum]|uniref:Uncharacterized protein n=1 Tax=Synchytrium microbalum TaxID=1806994 RepID=A0A507C8R0_9FUNG|nr:uncharacterized protein SmJEL517_g01755 [Synchytrium microbalum]TPX36012.1 hypothetical protein SmJEL517_g01755 [Synchytrium microbalum]